MAAPFHFKQFAVNQTNCAMKINTDGVLLGAMAKPAKTEELNILDIGTGTGVIALMLAQRFKHAQIDAVEIDELAAQTAHNNFKQSVFATRLNLYAQSFEQYLAQNPGKSYQLIVSNPPFYINALHSPKQQVNVAKHASADFFSQLLHAAARHLSSNGLCWLVLPPATAQLVLQMADDSLLFEQQSVYIQSFTGDEPHRWILVLGRQPAPVITQNTLVIYQQPKVYTVQYVDFLRDFFTIF
jgi:tRNA1Val (adenine37-N6)-methyltransferase